MSRIDELQRLHEAAHDGPWSFWPYYGIRPALKYGRGTQLCLDGNEEPGPDVAAIIALHNAWPAIHRVLVAARKLVDIPNNTMQSVKAEAELIEALRALDAHQD